MLPLFPVCKNIQESTRNPLRVGILERFGDGEPHRTKKPLPFYHWPKELFLFFFYSLTNLFMRQTLLALQPIAKIFEIFLFGYDHMEFFSLNFSHFGRNGRNSLVHFICFFILFYFLRYDSTSYDINEF